MLKSIITVKEVSSEGNNMISLPVSSSEILIISSTTKTSCFSFCSSRPADFIASIKYFEEPSIIGISVPLISMRQLLTDMPTKAASKCSQVWISTPSFSRVVPLSVFETKFEIAGISIKGSKSVLRKTKPELGGAGFKFSSTF